MRVSMKSFATVKPMLDCTMCNILSVSNVNSNLSETSLWESYTIIVLYEKKDSALHVYE